MRLFSRMLTTRPGAGLAPKALPKLVARLAVAGVACSGSEKSTPKSAELSWVTSATSTLISTCGTGRSSSSMIALDPALGTCWRS